ncbi:MAG: AtpZ/AtpI family protein [Candidatus Riflebacteria bacterium]|nr:AtpZ/AtpI family protein [Candidatus Riflebacteria bacterium]
MSERIAEVGPLLALGISWGLCIAMGVGGGIVLDGWLNSSPYGILIGFLVGIAAASDQTLKIIRQVENRAKIEKGKVE